MTNNLELLRKFLEQCENHKACVLCTVVEETGSTPRGTGASMLVFSDGRIDGTIGGGVTEHNVIERALLMMNKNEDYGLYREELAAEKDDETARLHAACGGAVAVFMQCAPQESRLVIFGAGHVGKAIAEIGEFAGFDVLTWDERDDFANAQNIPWGKTLCCPLAELPKHVSFGHECFVIVVTRGHALDAEAIRLLENVPAKYIGVIGSRTKIAYVREKLLNEGVSAAHMDRLCQPVGLPIRAETPEEIAVSVLAELIAVKRGGEQRNSELRKLWNV